MIIRRILLQSSDFLIISKKVPENNYIIWQYYSIFLYSSNQLIPINCKFNLTYLSLCTPGQQNIHNILEPAE